MELWEPQAQLLSLNFNPMMGIFYLPFVFCSICTVACAWMLEVLPSVFFVWSHLKWCKYGFIFVGNSKWSLQQKTGSDILCISEPDGDEWCGGPALQLTFDT